MKKFFIILLVIICFISICNFETHFYYYEENIIKEDANQNSSNNNIVSSTTVPNNPKPKKKTNTEAKPSSSKKKKIDGAYKHKVSSKNIQGFTFTNKHTKCAIEKFKNNDNNFDRLECNDSASGLNEFWFWYLGFEENYTKIYQEGDQEYRFYKLSDKDFAKGVAKLKKVESSIANYRNFICNALNNMNLYTTDRDLVNQINRFIVKKFSYKVTNNPYVYSFVNTGQGQCYHYANLFKDMCNAVGIECYYMDCVKSVSHAINRLVVDKKTYYFDVTANDTSGNTTKYSWMTKSRARQLYTW